jgi:hypothetical protein
MEQHSGAGSDLARERAQGKMSNAVPEKVDETLLQESVARVNVTVVT